jgi:short-subunit dehydrogenase
MINRRESLEVRYGPWAVVTGASEGIGRSFAGALARRGFHLVLVARRSQLLDALAANLTQAHGRQCEVLVADLSTAAGVATVLERTARHDVGLLVCAAGFGTSGRFLEGDIGDELDMLQVNCGASTALSWGFGRRFAARGRGGLILLSSIVAFQGVPRSAHYAATKSYVQTLAEGLRIEWADRGIDVLAVAPGPVGTGFARRAGLAMGRAESPDVVAAESLSALGRRGTVRPGLLAKVLGYGLAMTPRWGRIRIMAMVMRGMTKHHAA